jgi:RNA polymerase sigma factor (sigma-70 family)
LRENGTGQAYLFIDETSWEENYSQLCAQVRRLVHQLMVPDWQGQEEDIAWDIVQESMRRVYEYTQKAANGEREPVQSLTALLNTVAQNYCRDLRRRERRLSREITNTSQGFVDNEQSFSEIATENVYREHLFHILAHEIAQFPAKQRHALLTDLADRIAFGEKPSTLQDAFQAVGIRLEEYRKPHSECEQERARNAALLAHAYKRLRTLEKVQNYLSNEDTAHSQRKPADLTLPVEIKERRDMQTHEPEELPSAGTLPEHKSPINPDVAKADFIDQLPKHYQLPLRLHCFEKKSYAKIARQLGLSEGTVKSQISRGQKKLQELLEQGSVPTEANDEDVCEEIPSTFSEEQLAKLPAIYQTIIRLHYLEKKTYTEIADQLNIPKGTVKSYVSRGCKLLAQQK